MHIPDYTIINENLHKPYITMLNIHSLRNYIFYMKILYETKMHQSFSIRRSGLIFKFEIKK